MTAGDQVSYRLRLAQGFLDETRQDVDLKRWRSAMDNAQPDEKSFARCLATPSRSRDGCPSLPQTRVTSEGHVGFKAENTTTRLRLIVCLRGRFMNKRAPEERDTSVKNIASPYAFAIDKEFVRRFAEQYESRLFQVTLLGSRTRGESIFNEVQDFTDGFSNFHHETLREACYGTLDKTAIVKPPAVDR